MGEVQAFECAAGRALGIAGNPNPLREIDETLGFRQLTKLNGPPGLPKVGRSRDTQASTLQRPTLQRLMKLMNMGWRAGS